MLYLYLLHHYHHIHYQLYTHHYHNLKFKIEQNINKNVEQKFIELHVNDKVCKLNQFPLTFKFTIKYCIL